MINGQATEGSKVPGKALGGGSSAVAASAHAACARFRGTDPLITGVTRRALATALNFPDKSGRIPEARWMRAMTFERLVRDVRFASEVATTTAGRLGLDRPTGVITVSAHFSVETTAKLLTDAHQRAVFQRAATLIHGLAVPFAGFEETRATDVRPDFAVVAPQVGEHGQGSWLVMGDAKDYERVRSRIDDGRLLKGFLQVALGAESAHQWSQLPAGMTVHGYGVLAVPRNAFLQPEALVELLDDHRAEVRMRVAERRHEAAREPYDERDELPTFVSHLQATFDPASCTTCTLLSYCRDGLRRSNDPSDLLVELGVAAEARPHVVGLMDGSGVIGRASASLVANVTATLTGIGRRTGQLRTDQADQSGTVNVVIAKSDAAALGVHGVATQQVTASGRQSWDVTVFEDPQSADTRRAVMKLLGKQLTQAMTAQRKANREAPSPVHLVVPDQPTADVLVSIADNLAGVELSRLRWERDKQLGREALTFNGEPATIPPKLPESDRTAVSFLLEEDRARALTLRSPIVDVREALARHVVAGGPAVGSLRLDYLVEWAHATPDGPLEHRDVADLIEQSEHTPGARLTGTRSDAIHAALTGTASRRQSPPITRPVDPVTYDALVREELAYKCQTLERALDALGSFPDSTVREVHRAIEGDAQAVWRRRLSLHASDLVRFGRTYRFWRNRLVEVIERDGTCRKQLLVLANRQAAEDLAIDAGTRQVATASVVSTTPLVLDVESRRIRDGSRIVLLHVGDRTCVDDPQVVVKHQKGSFRFAGLSIGPLAATEDHNPHLLTWATSIAPNLEQGDRLIVADFDWFSTNSGNTFLNVTRPGADDQAAPKPACGSQSFDDDPDAHQYCCKPHEVAEADFADELARRRARGELNPQVWPPVVDGDAFEVAAAGSAVGDPLAVPAISVPDDVTMDDLE